MNVAVRSRRAAVDEKPSLGLGRWLHGRSIVATTKALHLLLWGGLVLTLLLASFAFLRPAPKAPAVKIPASTTGPEGVAQLFVAAWLSAPPSDASALAAYWPGRANLGEHAPLVASLAPPPLRVLRTASIGVTEVTPTYWAVLVGAVTQNAEAAPVTRFFRVPVMRTPNRVYVAAALPAEVAAPLGSRMPELAVGSADRPEPTDPVVAASARFLNALLAGVGELSRYTAPGAAVRAVRPAPYTGVELTGVASRKMDGGHVEVLVQAVGLDAQGRTTPLAYPLELAPRDGRWEVVNILLAPSIAAAQPDLTPEAVPTSLPVPSPVPSTSPSSTSPSTTSPAAPTTTLRRF